MQVRYLKIAIWSAVALLAPLYLYGVNEGYSVITESSPWGIVMGLDESVDYDTLPDSLWDSLYCPRLDSMQSCGLSWVRPNCGPGLKIDYPGTSPEHWHWEGQDSMVVFLQERDMNWLRVGWPPDWMTDSTQWWDYWYTVVERYDGDGDSLDMPGLTKPAKYWEIINEPYWYSMRGKCAGKTPVSVRRYFRVSGNAIHDADPGINGAKVVSLCLTDNIPRWELKFVYSPSDTFEYWFGDTLIIDSDTFEVDTLHGFDFYGRPCVKVYIDSILNKEGKIGQWLSYLLRDGAAEETDVVSWHLYQGSGPDFAHLDTLVRDTLSAYGLGDAPIWLTEIGWRTGEGGVSEETQASYYKRLCQMVHDTVWLGKVFFFADRDWGPEPTDDKWGIIEYYYTHKLAFDTIKTFINTNTPDIELTSPVGGEDWNCDSVYDITWSATDIQTPDNNLIINVAHSIDSGYTWIPITDNEANDGAYRWTIPNTPSDACRVRIRAKDSDNLEGQYISGIFTISDRTPPQIDLLNPTGGEKWEIGGLKRIEWSEPTDNVGVDSVRVLFTSNYPGSWDTIATLDPETTYYNWEIPDVSSSQCRIKVIAFDRALNVGEDVCEANFEIGPLFSTTELATAYNNQRKVCVDNSGNIYAIYYSGGVNDRVLFDYSPDDGNTWEQEGIGDGKFPAIVMDSQDGLDAFWIRQIVDEAGLWFKRKTTDWGDAVEIFHWPDGYPVEPPFQDHYLFPPSVAIDESDTAHICIETLVEYTDPGPGTYAWEWKLRYGKISVTNPEDIVLETLDTAYVSGYLPPPYDSIYNYYCSSIHLDRKGHPHITWNRPFWAETGEIYYKVKTDTGWSARFNISESPYVSSLHSFIDIYGDFVNVVWEEGDNICHRRKWLYGDWEDTETITDGGSPQIMDGCVITYSDSIAGKKAIYHREFDRTGWGDSVILTDMYEDCSYPQMCLSDSTLSVVWTEDTDDIYKVGMGMDTVFIPWQKSQTHLATSYNNGRKLIRDTDGRIHIVYQSDGYIYYTYTDDSLFSCDFLVGEGDLPSISLDSNENPWILWRNTTCDTILFSRFDYDSFTTPVSVYNNDSLSAPSFVVFKGDETHEAHLSVGILNPREGRVIYGIFNGAQLTHIDTLDTYEGDMARPSLAFIKGKSKVMVVWDRGGRIYYREKVEENKWGEIEVVSGEIRNSSNPQIDHYEGFVYVVWEGEEGDFDIYYVSKPVKGSWTEPIRVANTQGDSKYPVIGGGSHVVWQEEIQLSSSIYYSKIAGIQQPENLSGDTDAYCPYSVYYAPPSGDPNLFVVWTQRDVPYKIKMIKKVVTFSGGKMASSSSNATGPGNAERLSAVDGGACLAFTSGSDVMYAEYRDTLYEPVRLGDGEYPLILSSVDNTNIVWQDSCGIYSSVVSDEWSEPDTILTEDITYNMPLVVASSNYGYHIGRVVRSGNLWRIKHGIKRNNGFTESLIDSLYADSSTSPVSMSRDRIGNMHIVWEKGGNIYYTTCNGLIYAVYDTLSNTNLSKNPSIDVYGERVRVVWEDDGEVMFNSKWLGHSWEGAVNISETPDGVSRDPYVRGNAVIWSEEGVTSLRVFNPDDMDWGDILQFPSQDARYPQVAFYQTPHSTDMWLAWTEGESAPYDVILKSHKVARVPYICLDLGKEEPSVFTIRRGGYVEYGEGAYESVDTDPTSLVYRISGLDPGKRYRISVTYYQESGEDWEMRVLGDVNANTVIPSNIPTTETQWIPEPRYLDGALTLCITKVIGDYAICSGIVIYEFEEEGDGGGAQTAGGYRIFSLSQNYPNPTRGETVIRYSIPRKSNVSLKIYDICGRLIKTLVDGRKNAGYYRAKWDGRDNKGRNVASGVYFARLTAGGNTASRKLVVLR